jgi:hypothetical protein
VIKRLGEFSPIGRLFTLDCLMKITEIVQSFGFFISKIFLPKEWTKKLLHKFVWTNFANLLGPAVFTNLKTQHPFQGTI